MKKTLGGQRLGSGNKMQVDLHGFERSSHDMSYIWRSTMSAGTLVPFLKEVALPGDTFDIRLNCDIKTHPTIGPLFGSYKVQLDVFQIPIRLYHSALHNNKLGIGMNMGSIKLPKIEVPAVGTWADLPSGDVDNSQINPSCILSYLGIRGVGSTNNVVWPATIKRKFNAVPYLAYWDIYKNYYANKQETYGWAIHSEVETIKKTISKIVNETTTTDIPGPLDPFKEAVLVTPGDRIEIDYTPGAANRPNPATVIFNEWISGTNTPLDQVTDTWAYDDGGGKCNAFWTGNAAQIAGWFYKDTTTGNNAPPKLTSFELENIDDMRQLILTSAPNVEFVINEAQAIPPYNWPVITYKSGENDETLSTAQRNQESLGIKTYQSDLFNNWLSTEWIDGAGGINEITAVDTSGGSFNIDTLNLSKKVYDMLNRIAVSGGTYYDWLEAVYDHEAYNRAETPVYCGGLIKELVFQEVVSNSASAAGGQEQPLGQLAGKGVMGNKHKGGEVVIRIDEPSYIMGIISLTPRIDYSQGNKWDVNLDSLDDLHKPSLDQIGFQELITEQMAWWTTKPSDEFGTTWVQKSAGKQPAWINYMTNVNEVRGNFAIASNEMFMTLNRRYTAKDLAVNDMDIKDLTTYIDPSLFNHIFAQTSLDAQNFWAQISVDMTARRKMSAKVMPNL